MIKKFFFALCILLTNTTFSVNFPRLMIKIPTRSRPQQFLKVLDLYYQHLSGEVPYLFVITCDIDDITMNNNIMIEKLKKYPNLYVYYGNNKTKIEAYNNDMNHHDFDFVLITSDDTVPTKNYDKNLAILMFQNFPNMDGVINFHDGYVGPDLNTLPVIGKKYYDYFGYIYHPSYKSLCCDNELTLVSKMLGKELYCDQKFIRHEHPAHNPVIPYDVLYQNNDKYFQQDLANFHNRRANNFYLKIIRKIYRFALLTSQQFTDSINNIFI